MRHVKKIQAIEILFWKIFALYSKIGGWTADTATIRGKHYLDNKCYGKIYKVKYKNNKSSKHFTCLNYSTLKCSTLKWRNHLTVYFENDLKRANVFKISKNSTNKFNSNFLVKPFFLLQLWCKMMTAIDLIIHNTETTFHDNRCSCASCRQQQYYEKRILRLNKLMIQNAHVAGHDFILQNCTCWYIDSVSVICNNNNSSLFEY